MPTGNNDLKNLCGILACPDCAGGISHEAGTPRCTFCKRAFPVTDGQILSMMPRYPRALPQIYRDPDYLRYRALFEDGDASEVYYSNRNALFRWIHHSAHKRLHTFWTARHPMGWVVDAGCGTGDHVSYIADRTRLIGIDASLGSLRALRKKYPDVTLIQADMYRLPLRSGAIEGLFSIYNLEHLYYLDDALREIQRVLEPKGCLWAGLPAEGGLAWSLGRRVTTQRMYSRQYGIDYAKVMRIEHCNMAPKVMRKCAEYFMLSKKSYFPFAILPFLHPNLTISLEYINA